MLQANYIPLDSVFRKKGKFNDDQLGNTKSLVTSYFYFSNFCHTNFWAIASVNFTFVRKWEFWKSWKSTQVVGKFVDTKKLFDKNGCNQRLVEPIVMVYFILVEDPVCGVNFKWSQVSIADRKNCLYFDSLLKYLFVVSQFT